MAEAKPVIYEDGKSPDEEANFINSQKKELSKLIGIGSSG